MFTRKHYQVIAEIMARARQDRRDELSIKLILFRIEDGLADYFEQDNPCFDRQKFLDACIID